MSKEIHIFRSPESKAYYYEAYEAMLNQWPSDEELRKIQVPMLLLIGDHEIIYNPKQVIRRATHLVAGLKDEIIPNANHNAQVTAPE